MFVAELKNSAFSFTITGMISIVVPILNESKTVAELHKRLNSILMRRNENYEIIFIDDGSSDETLRIAKQLAPLKLIVLQRNYGQTAAIDAGIHASSGDVIVLLDADLQNDPAEILTLLHKIDEGWDVVIGRRMGREDAWQRMWFSRFANMGARIILGVPLHDFGCGFKVYRSKFIKDFHIWGESLISLVAVAKARGAKICEAPVRFHQRESGSSKIRILNMISGAFDLLGVAFFVRYFSRPLRFFGGWGVFFVILGLGALGISVLVGILFAVLGVLLFMMGLLAEILLRIYYHTSQTEPYMIKELIQQ